jgi:hypothetical protein
MASLSQAKTLGDTLEEPKIERVSVSARRRPLAAMLLIALDALLALISVPAGVSMMRDPTGSGIGAQIALPRLTQALPFVHDFFPVGIWLLTMYGVLPIVVAVGVWASKRWAWYASIFLGAVVVTWIGVELVMFYSLGFTWFYPLIGGIGLTILVLSLLPMVRRYLRL